MAATPHEDDAQLRSPARTSAVDVVHEEVRRAILSGRMYPGHHLREMQLAEALGVSRGPVREALLALRDEGLVVRVPFKGTFVARDDPKKLGEIFGVRRRVEPFVMGVARDAASSTELERVEALHHQLDAAIRLGDAVRCAEAHLAYHRGFYELSRHRVLIELWHGWEPRLRLALSRDRSILGSPSSLLQAHRDLQDAFLTGRPPALQAAVARHLRAADGQTDWTGGEPAFDERVAESCPRLKADGSVLPEALTIVDKKGRM